MSDYLAVAGVSAVLRYLLTNAVNTPPPTLQGSAPGITAISPDLIQTGTNEQAQLNLFLYYVSANPILRNLGLPSYNGQGGQVSNPPLALDLHYLVTAYGAAQFDPEILLGWAIKVFHDNPAVPSQTIQNALTALGQQPSPSPQAQLIAGSTLPGQAEQLRITPEVLTTEEIYRLWPAFQAPYRPSIALQVSVVVIQDTTPVMSNLPPKTWSVTTLPLQGPVVASLAPVLVTAGGVLTITGRNFLSASPSNTVVSFDAEPGVAAQTVHNNVIQVAVPALPAGTHTLRVQRISTFPPSTTPHQGFSSSSAPFQLVPVIESPVPSAKPGSSLTLTVSPAVGRTQQVTVYIGDNAIPINERPASGPASATTIAFPVPANLSAQSYPIRIEVDGAQSTLTATGAGQFTPALVVAS